MENPNGKWMRPGGTLSFIGNLYFKHLKFNFLWYLQFRIIYLSNCVIDFSKKMILRFIYLSKIAIYLSKMVMFKLIYLWRIVGFTYYQVWFSSWSTSQKLWFTDQKLWFFRLIYLSKIVIDKPKWQFYNFGWLTSWCQLLTNLITSWQTSFHANLPFTGDSPLSQGSTSQPTGLRSTKAAGQNAIRRGTPRALQSVAVATPRGASWILWFMVDITIVAGCQWMLVDVSGC